MSSATAPIAPESGYLVPRFSVVIPAYQAESTLEVAVRSALTQSRGDLEVIVADDGSTDATLEVARRLAAEDPRVRVDSAPNAGCSAARNRGFALARGEFCCLLDADDAFEPEFLLQMAAFIGERPGYDLYSCNGTRVFENGRSEPFFDGPEFGVETSWTFLDQVGMNRIFVMTMIRRSTWEQLGGFREDLRHAEDYEFWLRALRRGATHRYLPRRLGRTFEHAGGKSKQRIPHAQAQIRVFEGFLGEEDLTAGERSACVAKIESLRRRIRRIEMEQRVRSGDYPGARREYLAVRDAYLSRRKWLAGLVLMMISPRLYAAVLGRRAR